MTTSSEIDKLLKLELERLRRENPEGAAALLNAALGRPAGRSPTPTGPAYPSRTQHHTPLESESRFLRFAAWWDEVTCQACQNTDRHFDGLFEEREWISGPNAGGPKHWLSVSVRPLPETVKDPVTYVRYHSTVFCHKCLNANEWPLAAEHSPKHVEFHTTVTIPTTLLEAKGEADLSNNS